MFKKCDTGVLQFWKKNRIWGHIPHLYLRKNIFYCRIETHTVKGTRKFIRFSLHTTDYYEAREMVKDIENMDILFKELKELCEQLPCTPIFTPDQDSSKLERIDVLNENADKDLLKKIHNIYGKCHNIPLDSIIEDANVYMEVLKDLTTLKPDSLEHLDDIESARQKKECLKSQLLNMEEYKKTLQTVEKLIPEIQEFLYPTFNKQSSQPVNATPSYLTNTDKPLVKLPKIGILIRDMAAQKNNAESQRKKSLLKNMLEEVDISLEDDYSKLYDPDKIVMLGKNIDDLDVKGSVKCQHKRFLKDLIQYASTRSNYYYSTAYIGLLPDFKKTKRYEANPHKAYKPEELVEIFDPRHDFFKKNKDVFWACLIGLYTGSRTRAAITIQFKDIVQVDSLHCIDINLNHSIKKVKTDVTVRKVPIHSDLINLGFLDHVERQKKERNASDEDFIFPNCQTKTGNYNGHFMERKLFKFLKELNIKKDIDIEKNEKQVNSENKKGKRHRRKTTSDKHDFHSFRKNINLALMDVKVDATYINQIIGWEGKGVREIHYSKRELTEIKEQLEKLHYDFLEPAFAEWKKIMADK